MPQKTAKHFEGRIGGKVYNDQQEFINELNRRIAAEEDITDINYTYKETTEDTHDGVRYDDGGFLPFFEAEDEEYYLDIDDLTEEDVTYAFKDLLKRLDRGALGDFDDYQLTQYREAVCDILGVVEADKTFANDKIEKLSAEDTELQEKIKEARAKRDKMKRYLALIKLVKDYYGDIYNLIDSEDDKRDGEGNKESDCECDGCCKDGCCKCADPKCECRCKKEQKETRWVDLMDGYRRLLDAIFRDND